MAASTDADLRAAWRALAGAHEGEGWKTIVVGTSEDCTVLAGRRLPANEEALLVGFHQTRSRPMRQLPQGHGFEVVCLPSGHSVDDRLWLALARRSGASLDLFAMMSEDILQLLHQVPCRSADGLVEFFLSRIRAWQDFMDRRNEGLLSSAAELGLYGELLVLERILAAGMTTRSALEIWQGPLDGLHDFMPGTGSIEVKTTLAVGSFPIIVSSLDQLDDNLRQPLFLAAVRLALDASGTTLPEMADKIRGEMRGSDNDAGMLDVRLIQAGLLPTVLDRYTRRFRLASIATIPVSDGFPRLIRAVVHPAIRDARYDIDLDLAALADVGLSNALQQLGAI